MFWTPLTSAEAITLHLDSIRRTVRSHNSSPPHSGVCAGVQVTQAQQHKMRVATNTLQAMQAASSRDTRRRRADTCLGVPSWLVPADVHASLSRVPLDLRSLQHHRHSVIAICRLASPEAPCPRRGDPTARTISIRQISRANVESELGRLSRFEEDLAKVDDHVTGCPRRGGARRRGCIEDDARCTRSFAHVGHTDCGVAHNSRLRARALRIAAHDGQSGLSEHHRRRLHVKGRVAEALAKGEDGRARVEAVRAAGVARGRIGTHTHVRE
mmetsp:Transcript_31519/g.82364  ORF Transcript_31519/g.82364 Transcript_31519/m.82364 type:complete len:270 (-) Transcript_31519:352-1161(-)